MNWVSFSGFLFLTVGNKQEIIGHTHYSYVSIRIIIVVWAHMILAWAPIIVSFHPSKWFFHWPSFILRSALGWRLREVLWGYVGFHCVALSPLHHATCKPRALASLGSCLCLPNLGGTLVCATAQKFSQYRKMGTWGVGSICFHPSGFTVSLYPSFNIFRVFFIFFFVYFSCFRWKGKSCPSSILSGNRSGFKWLFISWCFVLLRYYLSTKHVSFS